MGDRHVCSLCNANLEGQQHIKVVFENWPVEEEIVYRRKGKEARKKQTAVKEVITALGMECLRDASRWADFPIRPEDVPDFFEDLRFLGKNPRFAAALIGSKAHCMTAACPHFAPTSEGECKHLTLSPYKGTGLDAAYCAVGHPGTALVRRKESPSSSWNILKSLWGFSAAARISGQGPTRFQRVYILFTYALPMLVGLLLWGVVVTPLWLGYRLKNRVGEWFLWGR